MNNKYNVKEKLRKKKECHIEYHKLGSQYIPSIILN